MFVIIFCIFVHVVFSNPRPVSDGKSILPCRLGWQISNYAVGRKRGISDCKNL